MKKNIKLLISLVLLGLAPATRGATAAEGTEFCCTLCTQCERMLERDTGEVQRTIEEFCCALGCGLCGLINGLAVGSNLQIIAPIAQLTLDNEVSCARVGFGNALACLCSIPLRHQTCRKDNNRSCLVPRDNAAECSWATAHPDYCIAQLCFGQDCTRFQRIFAVLCAESATLVLPAGFKLLTHSECLPAGAAITGLGLVAASTALVITISKPCREKVLVQVHPEPSHENIPPTQVGASATAQRPVVPPVQQEMQS
jgi:hypothetical protein